MANPYQDGQQYTEDGGYDQQNAAPAPAAAPAKKKRGYAGQAYEFGQGANAPQGGAAPPGVVGGQAAPAAAAYGYPGQQTPQQSAYGMPQQPAYGQPQPGFADPNAQAQAAYGQQPAYGAPQGGYEPPTPGYPQQGGVAGMTQQFGQMGMGGGGTPQPMPQQNVPQPAAQRLNPLVPTDISMQGQPFHVSDLDMPPPPIILPPNVRIPVFEGKGEQVLMQATVLGHAFTARELSAKVCAIDA